MWRQLENEFQNYLDGHLPKEERIPQKVTQETHSVRKTTVNDDLHYLTSKPIQDERKKLAFINALKKIPPPVHEIASLPDLPIIRYQTSTPKEYLRQYATTIGGTPEFQREVRELAHVASAYKTNTRGDVGEICTSVLPPLPLKRPFEGSTETVKRAVPDHAVPEHWGDLRKGQKVKTTLGLDFEYTTSPASAKLAYEQYRADKDQQFRTGMIALLIAALIILPLVPP